MHTAFIDELQLVDHSIQGVRHFAGKRFAQALYPRRVSLTVVDRLFLRGRSSRWSSRHIILGLAWALWRSATCSHNSAKVISGCCLTAARIAAVHPLKTRGLPPAWGSAATLRVVRQRRHHVSTVDWLTPNVSAISDWDCTPCLMTAMTRSRRSCE